MNASYVAVDQTLLCVSLLISPQDGSLQAWQPVSVSEDLQEAVKFLATSGMSHFLQEWIVEIIFQDLCRHVEPEFWKFFSKLGKDSDKNRAAFCDAVDYLYSKSYTEY